MSEINDLTIKIIKKVLELQEKERIEDLVHIVQHLEWVDIEGDEDD